MKANNRNSSKEVATQYSVPVDSPERKSAGPSWWQELFVISGGLASTRDVFRWWEHRRWNYNWLLLILGVPSFLAFLFFILSSGHLRPGEDAVEPMAVIASPLLANICYSFGLIAEVLWRLLTGDKTRRAGLILMKLGVGFTLFLIFLPTTLWGGVWLWRVVLRQ